MEPKEKCWENTRNWNGRGFTGDGHPCPYNAKFLVVTEGWTRKMCGTHAKPWQRDYPSTAYYGPSKRAEVTPL